ncbi:DUF1573 domain-containing protein [Flaviaesturariibacter amylovorans]|uniref:DUF1573 domain-containing protein n=1 Tax=Flaviaesturariibacter amylovorans TaxID=1084520 RepID=A0ABP8GKD1_9BACT
MRKLLLLAAVLVGSLAGNAQDKKAEEVIKVNTEAYSFGKIKQGVPVTTYFEVTNISDKPVVIENAWGSCGCTTPEVPKEPIAPGQTTKVKVAYNAAAMGAFNKDVYIKLAGVSAPKNVKINGEVVDAASFDKSATSAKPAVKPAGEVKTKVKTENSKTKVKAKA